MVSINYAFKEIISKIVYYGPGLSGKTTNLQHVFKKVPKDTRGELISLATDADRTLYFDFLPVNVGNIRGFQVKFQLYTVPGQVYYNATRKLVLRGVDGLVFVADSQLDKMDENIESLKNLEENLAEYGYNLSEMPFVIQYNKRDLPNIATIEQLQQQLNTRNVPVFEAVATSGGGVFATLKAISKIVIEKAQKSSAERTDSKTAVVAAMDTSAPKPQPQQTAPPPQPGNEIAPSPAAEVKPENAPYELDDSPSGEVKPQVEQAARAEINPEQRQAAELSSNDSEIKPKSAGQSMSDQVSPGIESSSSQAMEYGELPEEATNTRIGDKEQTQPEPRTQAQVGVMEKPQISKDSELMTNVVVSSSPDDEQQVEDVSQHEDIEETTEHAALKEDIEEINVQKQAVRKHHPDVLDADKLDYLREKLQQPAEAEPQLEQFDQEETVISDPKQTGNAFSKPQMAESTKVKGKKKSGLFGWLKGKKQ